MKLAFLISVPLNRFNDKPCTALCIKTMFYCQNDIAFTSYKACEGQRKKKEKTKEKRGGGGGE